MKFHVHYSTGCYLDADSEESAREKLYWFIQLNITPEMITADIVMPDQNTYEGTVKRTRHGVCVNVPRHWSGEKVRVTIIKENHEKIL